MKMGFGLLQSPLRSRSSFVPISVSVTWNKVCSIKEITIKHFNSTASWIGTCNFCLVYSIYQTKIFALLMSWGVQWCIGFADLSNAVIVWYQRLAYNSHITLQCIFIKICKNGGFLLSRSVTTLWKFIILSAIFKILLIRFSILLDLRYPGKKF